MGAKFAPCMRSDKRLKEVLAEEKKYESETGCCVKSDDSGCIQTSEKECSVSHVHHAYSDFKFILSNLKANLKALFLTEYFRKPGPA